MKAFVTATGTEIGKTYVTCGLLRTLRRAGRETLALKPVVSGFAAETMGFSDPALLLQAQGRPPAAAAIAAIAPWRFAAPLSPDMAARREGRTLDYGAILRFCRDGQAGADGSVVIEGVGGVCVPLGDSHTMLDLIADLALPVVLVTGSYLGTLSHTLTALAVLRARAVRAVVVVNQSPGVTPDLTETAAIIAHHGDAETICLGREDVPHDAVFERIVRAVGGS